MIYIECECEHIVVSMEGTVPQSSGGGGSKSIVQLQLQTSEKSYQCWAGLLGIILLTVVTDTNPALVGQIRTGSTHYRICLS